MSMNITQLIYFIELAKLEHISNVSYKLNISQPALSKSLSRLEDELGCKLFDRAGRGIKLNKYGQSFLPYAKSIVEIYQNSLISIKDLARTVEAKVAIQAIPLVLFPGLLDQILNICPDVEITDAGDPSHIQKESLLNGATDLCLSHTYFHSRDINSRIVTETPCLAVMPLNHRLKKYDSIPLSALTNEKFVIAANSASSDNYQRLFKNMQHKPLIGASVRNVNELFFYVNHNKGIAILSEFAYNDLLKRSLDEVHAAYICDESDNPLTIPYYLYWRRSGNTDAVIQLRDCIINYFHDLK